MQKLQLSIPEPCHQDWNDMSPNEQGRFCSSCAKTVIDFSAMTDAQLILYFENLKNENVCGRVYSDQLDRPIETMLPSRKKISWYWQYVIAFFIMLSKGQQAKAQGEVRPQTTQQPDITKDSPETVHIIAGRISRPLPPQTKKIAAALPQYFITDEKQQPVAGASVQLLPQGIWLVSDSTGKINLGLKHTVKSLQISSVGFEEKTIALKDVAGNNIIRLTSRQQSLEAVTIKSDWSGRRMGMMMRCTTSYITISNSDSVHNIFNPVVSVYPNPVAKGGILTPDLSLQKGKQYKIQVIDASGKLVLQQNYTAADKKNLYQVMIPAGWSNGIYFVSVIDKKGKVMGTSKVAVQ